MRVNRAAATLAAALAVFPIVHHMPAAEKSPPKKAPGPKAKRTRPKPIVSPVRHEDGKITFQVRIPTAEKVYLAGQMLKRKRLMSADENGLWSVTIPSIEPGVYEYSFEVDGQRMVDPGNSQIKPMRSPRTSILHVWGGKDNPHHADFRADIPHGTVHCHAYHSKSIDRFREIQVYTPPGYERSRERYPLLVLQHGHSDSFATWIQHGKAHWILDNLIADGKARPMIVIFADGHPIPGSYGDGRSTANTEELRRDLLEDALPMAETLYRVAPGRENRAISGLSMGGLHSLTIGLNELDSFAWVGAFSAAVPRGDAVEAALSDSRSTNRRLKLLWIACGEEDFLSKENRAFVESLKRAGVRHEFHETAGKHSWPVWRGYLTQFAPRLFQ